MLAPCDPLGGGDPVSDGALLVPGADPPALLCHLHLGLVPGTAHGPRRTGGTKNYFNPCFFCRRSSAGISPSAASPPRPSTRQLTHATTHEASPAQSESLPSRRLQLPQGDNGRVRLLCPDRLQGPVQDWAGQQRRKVCLWLPGGESDEWGE